MSAVMVIVVDPTAVRSCRASERSICAFSGAGTSFAAKSGFGGTIAAIRGIAIERYPCAIEIPCQSSIKGLVIGLLALQTDLPTLEARVRRSPGAANVRALADGYLRARRFDKASSSYARASELYAKLRDPNAAKVLRGLSERYRTDIGLYIDREPTPPANLALFEPAAGCLLGAFIDREDGIGRQIVADGRRHGDPERFADETGRRHAMVFTYVRLGANFPKGWLRRLRQLGMAAHLAVEPTSVAQGSDPNLLRELADDCQDAGLPIFLRFAGEMNGAWTPYSRDPAGYRRMFANAARIIRDRAPNVAMVWCPNDIPEGEIDRYYPGEANVDWVGVNFYSVFYNDGDRAKAAGWRNPLDSLAYVYNRYSSKHPIMIGEWAATHRSAVDGVERSAFAREKIGALYGGLPRRYPRVKAVNWLSMDTITYAMPGRRLNDFSLLGSPAVASKYREEVASPYYLSAVGESAPFVPVRLGDSARAGDRISVDARTYFGSPTVEVMVDGSLVRRLKEPGEIAFPLPETTRRSWRIVVRVLDDRGSVAGRVERTIVSRTY